MTSFTEVMISTISARTSLALGQLGMGLAYLGFPLTSTTTRATVPVHLELQEIRDLWAHHEIEAKCNDPDPDSPSDVELFEVLCMLNQDDRPVRET